MALPPDRGHLVTEQRRADSRSLDALSTEACVRLMARDHERVTRAVMEASPQIAALIDAIYPRIAMGGRLIYLGAGTSGRLGVLDAAECPPTFQSDPAQVVGIIAGGDAALKRSSESREDEPEGAAAELDRLSVSEPDTLIGIAAGGTTPYVLGGLTLAKARDVMTGLLTCVHLLQPPPSCDHLIVLDTGPELLTGSTRLKAGSATKLALNVISTVMFTRLGKVYSNLMVDMRATNQKLTDRAIRILIELCPQLSRDEAATALDVAGGELKVAIVMTRLNVNRDRAASLLEEHDGRLRAILNAGDDLQPSSM